MLPTIQSISGDTHLLLAHHVARRLQVSVRTVRYWAQAGKLPGLRLNETPKIWRFDPAVVEAFAHVRFSWRSGHER